LAAFSGAIFRRMRRAHISVMRMPGAADRFGAGGKMRCWIYRGIIAAALLAVIAAYGRK